MFAAEPQVANLVETSAPGIFYMKDTLGQGDRTRRALQDQTGDRAKVVEAYRDVINLTGDVPL